jgi:hypothetical protein
VSAVTETNPELHKLAHQLGVEPEQLDFLEAVPIDDLRALRQQIGDYLFEADKHHFTKVAAISRLVPVAIAAKVTEFALPPMIAARTAELLDPAKAAEMVGRLSDGYLADVSAAMDPTRAPEVIARIPPAHVSKVGAELARRGEWVVMGGFVSVVSGPSLKAAVTELNGEELLRVGFVLDDLSRMDEIAALLSDEQLDGMLSAAVEHDLWPELDGVLTSLTGKQATRIAGRYALASEPTRAAIEAAPVSAEARAALAA